MKKRNHVLMLFGMLLGVQLQAQDMTLQDALQIALQQNFDVRIARSQQAISASQNTAAYAGLLPQVQASAGYSTELLNSEQQFITGDERIVSNAGADALDLGVFVNYTLFDGMSRTALRDQLQLQADISNLQTRNTIEQTILALSAAWYTAIQLNRTADVLHQTITVSNERYRIASYRESIGAGSRLDMMQALVDLRSDSAQLAATEMQMAQQLSVINNLLARKPETPLNITDTLVLQSQLAYADIMQAAEENTSVISANARKAYMESLVSSSKSVLMPTLSVQAGYSYFRSTSEAGFVSSNINLGPSAGLTLQVPIFNGGVNKNNVRIAEQQAAIAQETLQKQLMDVYQQTYAAWQSYSTAQYLTRLALDNEKTAIENTQIALEKFNSGAISSIDLRAIQQSRIDAGNQVSLYMLETKLAELELLYLSGQLIVKESE